MVTPFLGVPVFRPSPPAIPGGDSPGQLSNQIQAVPFGDTATIPFVQRGRPSGTSRRKGSALGGTLFQALAVHPGARRMSRAPASLQSLLERPPFQATR